MPYQENMKKRILFIEDQNNLQKLVAHALEEHGLEVSSALNGQEGIEKAIEQKPDLILLDLILPKKDGFEVLKQLKTQEQTKNIPVIILTNLDTSDNVQKAIDLGATTYLIKSNYKLEEIVEIINKVIK